MKEKSFSQRRKELCAAIEKVNMLLGEANRSDDMHVVVAVVNQPHLMIGHEIWELSSRKMNHETFIKARSDDPDINLPR